MHEDFITETEATFEVREEGYVRVSYSIVIENLKTERFAKSFKFSLGELAPTRIKAFDQEGELGTRIVKSGNETLVEVGFRDAVVGQGKRRQFSLEFRDDSLIKRIGQVWEINLPRRKEDIFGKYTLQLVVPANFQSEAFVTPRADSVLATRDSRIYVFSGEDVRERGVTAAFGSFQVYTFSLRYEAGEREILIPPDTAFQKVIYEEIIPEPENVGRDEEGNWVAIFGGDNGAAIEVRGHAQLFAVPRPFFVPEEKDLNKNLVSGHGAPGEIVFNNPREVYDFVVSEKKSVEEFISLAKVSGIPARAAFGWADAASSKTHPLNYASGKLHSWAEYFDPARKAWIGVDPSWAASSGGDYYAESDLRHVVFSAGKEGSLPVEASLSLSVLPPEREEAPMIRTVATPKLFAGSRKSVVEISNPGPVALYDRAVEVLFDGRVVDTIIMPELLPYSKQEIGLSVPVGILGSRAPNEVLVRYAGAQHALGIDRYTQTLTQLAVILTLILAASLILFRKTGFLGGKLLK